jgi:hypothetical protein
MKKLDLGQTLGLIANLGVIAGILLLVFELNQNRDMMRAQTRNELSRGLNELMSITISNADLADIAVRADSGEPLAGPDALRLARRNELAFRYWENVHCQYRQGLYDESEFSRHADTMAAVLARTPSMVAYWCVERLFYSIPFMEFIDRILERQGC